VRWRRDCRSNDLNVADSRHFIWFRTRNLFFRPPIGQAKKSLTKRKVIFAKRKSRAWNARLFWVLSFSLEKRIAPGLEPGVLPGWTSPPLHKIHKVYIFVNAIIYCLDALLGFGQAFLLFLELKCLSVKFRADFRNLRS